MTHVARAVASLALGSLLLVGCGAHDTAGPTDPSPSAFAPADTPDQLVANFARAYGEMNLPEYERTLHDEFEFVYLPDDEMSTASTQARDQELASADRVFGGHGHEANGSELAAVSAIDLALEPIDAWEDLGQDQHRRVYRATMLVQHADGSRSEVVGLQQLTVARDGEEYRLLGWRDLGAL